MERIRSFIAIELPDTLKRELSRLEDELKKAAPNIGIKWVNPHAIHLTLKFLGSINVDRISSISKVMELTGREATPFQLKPGVLGAFPSLRRPQVVWIGLSGEIDRLKALQQRLDSSLTNIGFAAESRSFSPHLTLARLRQETSLREWQNLGEVLAKTSVNLVAAIDVSAISLMRSELTRTGVIYHRICSAQFNKREHSRHR